ncbi:MAG TPA: hypothetical protein VGK99_03995 [Acidobacteriota bacterium]|jgi:hypothetical protein
MSEIHPAVMYEKEAAKYVRLGIHQFLRLVNAEKIPCRNHEGGMRRIYLKADLDNYLQALPRCKIVSSKRRLSL